MKIAIDDHEVELTLPLPDFDRYLPDATTVVPALTRLYFLLSLMLLLALTTTAVLHL